MTLSSPLNPQETGGNNKADHKNVGIPAEEATGFSSTQYCEFYT